MIEVFFLLLLIGSSSAAINLFKDGDFEAFVGNNVNSFTDSWYCGVGTKMDFWVEDIGNDKAVLIDLICLKICQNVTFSYAGDYRLSFTYKGVVATPILQYEINDVVQYYFPISMTNYLYINFTDPIPEVTTLKLCFNNANTTSVVRFDNASITQVNYPETVTYEIERDLETINAILISIVFQDFFQEKYWVGGELAGKNSAANRWSGNQFRPD